MLLIALIVLNAICLISGLLFNAELLNMAGADIPLKQLQTLEIYSQILASASVACSPGGCAFGLTADGEELVTSVSALRSVP
ncbi:hypothetical protein OE415_24975 [Pseudomonas aeruginosa]|nr:hypothetical protein [Pseudomonas aeruginosa]